MRTLDAHVIRSVCVVCDDDNIKHHRPGQKESPPSVRLAVARHNEIGKKSVQHEPGQRANEQQRRHTTSTHGTHTHSEREREIDRIVTQ